MAEAAATSPTHLGGHLPTRQEKVQISNALRLPGPFSIRISTSALMLVLKSRKQGTGKSTLGKVMLDIFGQHGALIDDKERLLGRFTDWLESICFVVAEEILFAGDLKSADKLKSVITGDTIQVERKFGSCRPIPNRLKTLVTTNHDHAVAAGVQDRRNVVFDVSDERAGDKAWFDALYKDLGCRRH